MKTPVKVNRGEEDEYTTEARKSLNLKSLEAIVELESKRIDGIVITKPKKIT